MNPQRSRNVLLIRAVEEMDADGVLLTATDREQATENARPPEATDESAGVPRAPTREERKFIARRAEILERQLSREHPEIASTLHAVRWRRPVAALVVIIAFVVGILSNRLGAERTINIIAFPLIAMVAWNLLVYLLLLVRLLFPPANHSSGRNPISMFFQRITAPAQPVTVESGSDSHAVLIRALGRFTTDWFKATTRYHWACTRELIHLTAAMLAIGAVAGLYARGLYLEYQAGWESLWLDAAAVETLLLFFLTPASVLTGIPIPNTQEISNLQLGSEFSGENAARWIHLYSMTAAIFIIVPRLALATLCNGSARRRLARVLDWEWKDPYFRRLLQVSKGLGEQVNVIAYSFHPSETQRESLRVLLHDLWGGRAQLDFLPTVNYGDEEEFLTEWKSCPTADHTVVLFNIASTPEDENHGVLLTGLQQTLRESQHHGDLLVTLDASAFDRFLGSDTYARRIEERARTWQQMLDRHGLRFAITHRPAANVLADEVAQLVWTP